jgi:antitoxin ParD1/3/4
MNVSLSPKTQKLLKARIKKGGYGSADDAVRASLTYLEQQEHLRDFEPGELQKLLAVADGEIERGELLDGEEVFREIRGRRIQRKGKRR